MKHYSNALCLTAAAVALLATPAVTHAQQTLYVATQSNLVEAVSSAGTASAYAKVGYFSTENIFGLAFDASGNLFVMDESTNVISKISPDGTVTPFALLPAASEGSGIALDTSGNLYTANYGTDTISKIDPNGEVTPFATLPKHSGPNDLAFDTSGNLFVANQTSNTVSKINPKGKVSTFAEFSTNSGTNGLAFDKSGNLFVSNYQSGKIKKIAPDGTKSTFARLGNQPEPLGLAFDQKGNLYVAVVSGIIEISADGQTVSNFTQDSNDPTYVAFGPVPVH